MKALLVIFSVQVVVLIAVPYLPGREIAKVAYSKATFENPSLKFISQEAIPVASSSPSSPSPSALPKVKKLSLLSSSPSAPSALPKVKKCQIYPVFTGRAIGRLSRPTNGTVEICE